MTSITPDAAPAQYGAAVAQFAAALNDGAAVHSFEQLQRQLGELALLLRGAEGGLRRAVHGVSGRCQLQALHSSLHDLAQSQAQLVEAVVRYSRRQRGQAAMDAGRRSALALAALQGSERLAKTDDLVMRKLGAAARRNFQQVQSVPSFAEWSEAAYGEQSAINADHGMRLNELLLMERRHYSGNWPSDSVGDSAMREEALLDSPPAQTAWRLAEACHGLCDGDMLRAYRLLWLSVLVKMPAALQAKIEGGLSGALFDADEAAFLQASAFLLDPLLMPPLELTRLLFIEEVAIPKVQAMIALYRHLAAEGLLDVTPPAGVYDKLGAWIAQRSADAAAAPAAQPALVQRYLSSWQEETLLRLHGAWEALQRWTVAQTGDYAAALPALAALYEGEAAPVACAVRLLQLFGGQEACDNDAIDLYAIVDGDLQGIDPLYHPSDPVDKEEPLGAPLLVNHLAMRRQAMDHERRWRVAYLEELFAAYDAAASADATDAKEAYYVTRLQQFIGDPLASFDPRESLQRWSGHPLTALWEAQGCHRRGASAVTLRAKTEGLCAMRRLQQGQGASAATTLVSGAGPAGLAFALCEAVAGRQPIVIEKRSAEDFAGRSNLVAIGKADERKDSPLTTADGTPMDLALLDFLGVTDALLLKQKAFFARLAPQILEVAVADLQLTLAEQLQRVLDDAGAVRHGCQISYIKRQGDDRPALVTVEAPQGKWQLQPEVVFIAEGARAPSCAMLGLMSHKVTAKTQLAFASFQRGGIDSTAVLTNLWEIAADSAAFLEQSSAAMQPLRRAGLRSFTRRVDFIQTLSEELGRSFILLGTPQSDYLYSTLTPGEEMAYKEIQRSLAQLNHALNQWSDALKQEVSALLSHQRAAAPLRQQAQRCFELLQTKEWWHEPLGGAQLLEALSLLATAASQAGLLAPPQQDELAYGSAELAQLVQRQGALRQRYQQLCADLSVLPRDIMEFIYTLHKMDDAKRGHSQSFTATAAVRSGATSLCAVGETLFSIGGDALMTTDPLSGWGLRSALVRAVAAHRCLSGEQLRDPLAQMMHRHTVEGAAQRTVQRGLAARQRYRSGTLQLSYCLKGLEKKLSPPQRQLITQLDDKRRHYARGTGAALTAEEQALARQLLNDVGAAIFDPARAPQTLDGKEELLLLGLSQFFTQPAERRELNAFMALLRGRQGAMPSTGLLDKLASVVEKAIAIEATAYMEESKLLFIAARLALCAAA